MNRMMLMLIAAVVLISCGPSKQEKLDSFLMRCSQTEFSKAQCQLLAEMYGESMDATAMAAAATAVGATGAGIAAGGMGVKVGIASARR